MTKATVQSGGDAVVVEVSKGVLKPGTGLRAVFQGPEALVLLREGLKCTGFIAGSLDALSIAEVFGHLISGVRTGKLVLTLPGGARKTVSLRDGQIIFATSSLHRERLGQSLVQLGIVTGAQLKAALADVKPGVRLGQVLTRRRLVSPTTLYSGMTYLVREVVLGLFENQEGEFLFLDGLPHTDDVLKLPDRTRDLVLEGLKRAEEVYRMRQRFPASLRWAAGKQEPSSEDDGALVARAGTGADLATLRAAFGGCEHALLTKLSDLLGTGALVETARVPEVPVTHDGRPAARSALDRYGGLIRMVCDALRSVGMDLTDLQSFFENPPPGFEEAFEGVTLSESGEVSFERLKKNVSSGGEALGRAIAYEALDAFLAYALFSAKNALPADQAESLQSDFRRLQEGLEE